MLKSIAFMSVAAWVCGCAVITPTRNSAPTSARLAASGGTNAVLPCESDSRSRWLKVGDSFLRLSRVSVVRIDTQGTTMAFLHGSDPGDTPFFQSRSSQGVKEQLDRCGWVLLKQRDTTSPDPVGTVLFVNPAVIVQIAPQPTPALPEGDALAVYVDGVQRPVGLAFGDSIKALMRLVGEK